MVVNEGQNAKCYSFTDFPIFYDFCSYLDNLSNSEKGSLSSGSPSLLGISFFSSRRFCDSDIASFKMVDSNREASDSRIFTLLYNP